jgi:hypothetical protein
VSGGEQELRALAEHTPVRAIGTVGGDTLQIEFGRASLSATLEELTDAHTSLRELFP